MTPAPIHSPGQIPSEQTARSIEPEEIKHDGRCDEALISRQRQRYLVSLLIDQEQQSDTQYREQ